jgi:hypothetical protein
VGKNFFHNLGDKDVDKDVEAADKTTRTAEFKPTYWWELKTRKLTESFL